MKGNAHIIGPKAIVSKTSAKGVFDTFDNFNSRSQDKWPVILKILFVTSLGVSVLENSQVSCSVTSSDLVADETLYWKVIHGTTTSADFFVGTVQGTFTQSSLSQTGSFSFVTSFIGNPSKPTRTFQIQILRGGYTGTVLYTSGTTTILNPTLASLVWTTTTVNETNTKTSNLRFYLSNVGSNLAQTFNISYTGTAVSSDFADIPTTRTQQPATFTEVQYIVTEDILTEGSETLTASVSYNGNPAWGSATLNITDTSLTPAITITPSTTSVTEGSTVNFTITDSNGGNGTLYWTVTTLGGVTAADFTPSVLSGSFTLTSGSGSVSLSPVGSDGTESESFTLQVRRDSISGTVLQTSTTISIFNAEVVTSAGVLANTAGSRNWTVPSGVTSITVVCVGGGGGSAGSGANRSGGAGGGGALAYANNISVTPGEVLEVNVGAGGAGGANSTSNGSSGGASFVKRGATTLVQANGGGPGIASGASGTAQAGTGGAGGTVAVGAGGSGGNGGLAGYNAAAGAGGGAGGYIGNGGNGGGGANATTTGLAGAGGGGGGGGSGSNGASGGGGVGVYGQGTNGAGGTAISGGGGGSGGNSGTPDGTAAAPANGGLAGGGGASNEDDTTAVGGAGGQGLVRIIWPGNTRSFPTSSVSLGASSGGETTI